MYTRFLKGLGLSLVLSLFFQSYTYAYTSYGPQPKDGKYYFWGSTEEPQFQRNGITIVLDETSISYNSIKATVTVDHEIIQNRGITAFEILANGIAVEQSNVYYDATLEPPTMREYYVLDIALTEEFTGSYVYFQALGVSHQQNETYVVAWSSQTQTVQFKPFPVIDRDAITWLEAIYNKIQDMKTSLETKLTDIYEKLAQMQAALENKLDTLTKAVEDAYTPSPTALQNFDRAMDNFMDALPMSELVDELNQVNNTLQESINQLKNHEDSNLEFGGKFRLIPELPESEVVFLDLSGYRDQLILFRTLLEAMLWLYFFQMLMNRFTPRTTI